MHVRTWAALSLAAGGALVACSGGDSRPPDAPPTVSATPRGGAYAHAVEVTLSCTDDAGACDAVFLTVDGSEPGATSTRYAGPVTIAESTTLRFRGRDRGGQLSAVGVQQYVIDTEPPLVSAMTAGGWYADPRPVVLVCSDGAGSGCGPIRYTLDGTAPTDASPAYGAPIVATDGTELRFVAVDAVGNRSVEGRETYHVDGAAPVSTPSPAPGFFADAVDVTLSCDDANGAGCAAIHYTLDDTVPSVLSAVYEAPLHLTATTRVRAAAVDAVGNVEPAREWEYQHDGIPPTTSPSWGAGAYRTSITVALECWDYDSGCGETRYTLDGTPPGPASARYQDPIPLLTTTTIRFASVDAVGNVESPGEATYVIDGDAPRASATPTGGTYAPSVTVVLACDDGAGSGCAGLRYTLDGSVPTDASPLYSDPVVVSASGTLRFRARDAAGNETFGAETYVVDTAPPRLVATSPEEGAGAAEPGAVVQLTFDEPIAAEGLGATVNGTPAELALDGAAKVVTVTPAAPLAVDAACTVALSGVRDAFGNALPAPVTLSFRTRGDVLSLSGPGSATILPQSLAYDAAGNAVVVFNAHTGKLRKTMMTRFDAASETWGPEVELSRDELTNASGWPNPVRTAAVASNGTGFLVAWSTAAPTAKARFVDAAGALGPELPLFGTAHLLGVASNGTGYVVVVSTPNGLASRAWDGALWSLQETFAPLTEPVRLLRDGNGYLAAWRESVTGGSSIWVARSTTGTAWSVSSLYSTTASVTEPSVAAGPNGVRAVAFSTSGAIGAVFASVDAGSGFPEPTMIANGDQPTSASVAVSRDGVAVLWQARADGGAATYARIQAGGTWGTTETLATSAGTPLGAAVASDGAGFLAVVQLAGGPVLRARTGATWGDATGVAPGAGSPVLLVRPPGYVLAFGQDDRTRHQLRLRSHTGAQGEAGLGALVEVPTSQPGSARELRLAADGSGGSLAVWTQEHRGAPAVLAAIGRHGAFEPPFVVALGADSPAIASNGSTFVVAYRRGAACEAVVIDGGTALAPAILEDGAGGACSRPRIASDGVGYVAGWRRYAPTIEYESRAAVFDGADWSVPATLHSTGYVYADVDVAASGGVFGVAMDPSGMDGSVLFSSSGDGGATFESPRVLDDFEATEGPRVAAGPAGFAVLWTSYTHVYGTVSSGGAFPSRTTVANTPGASCTAPALVAGPGGFLSAFDCYAPYVAEWSNGWKPATALSSVPTDGIQLAGSPSGYAILYRERTATPSLRGGTRSAGVWRVTTVRSNIAPGPALAWDGEAHVVAWSEVGSPDAGADAAFVRRGL